MFESNVVIRHNLSGVWFAKSVERDGDDLVLKGARRAHMWYESIDCTDLALHGPGPASRVTGETSVVLRVEGLVEAQPATPEAVERWGKCPVASRRA